jgi:N-acetylmuramoyl-L-alanine amidase
MALRRVWKPVSHYSTGRSPVRLIVLHTTEGAQTNQSLYNWFSNPSAKVSSHVSADNTSRGELFEYVKRQHSAWAQGNYNGVSICIEMCTPSGAANGWSRDTWLSKGVLLDNCAAWIAEEAKAYNIPIVRLSPSQAQSSGRGLCGHVDIQPQDRTDPGRNFPWDVVIAKAKGQAPTPTPPAEGDLGVSATGVIVNSKLHQACVWSDGRVHYQFESAGWYQVDTDNAFRAKSGATITANMVTGLLVIMFTGLDSNVYSYQQRLADPHGSAARGKWARVGRGGHNSVR